MGIHRNIISPIHDFWRWKMRQYGGHAPQSVKQKVFVRHSVAGAPWIETGTYKGTTTQFLSDRAPHVISIEPETKLFAAATRKFEGKNVKLINGTSEEVFPDLIPTLSGDINFWLDGHFSGGITFKGQKVCPVEDELSIISANLPNFGRVSILIDDVRLFSLTGGEKKNYPSIDRLVDWAREHGFNWRVEHDIFIMKNWS